MYKQIIIARKDLHMTPGKLAAQVSHGSIAFLSWMIRNNTRVRMENRYHAFDQFGHPQYYKREDLNTWAEEARKRAEPFFYARPKDFQNPYGELELCGPEYHYETIINFDKELYEQWLEGSFTKCILEARNRNHLLKAKAIAEELGLKEGEDFWLIRDNCCTELEPEDEDGRTLTVIGFKPMDSEIIDKVGKKFQLYKG